MNQFGDMTPEEFNKRKGLKVNMGLLSAFVSKGCVLWSDGASTGDDKVCDEARAYFARL